jgi:hypothetical protein
MLKTKFKPDQIVRAIDGISFSDDDGVPQTVPVGMRLRGDHPAVRKVPELFIEDGEDGDAAFRAAHRQASGGSDEQGSRRAGAGSKIMKRPGGAVQRGLRERALNSSSSARRQLSVVVARVSVGGVDPGAPLQLIVPLSAEE